MDAIVGNIHLPALVFGIRVVLLCSYDRMGVYEALTGKAYQLTKEMFESTVKLNIFYLKIF